MQRNPQPSTTRAERPQEPAIDAIELLKGDHRRVEALFSQFRKASGDEAETAVEEICDELEIHTQLEEAYFYPAVRKELGGEAEDLIKDGVAEHHAVQEIVAKLRAMSGSEENFAELVVLLQQQVEHHVEEEEHELFPLVRKGLSGERLEELAEQMGNLRERLTSTIH